MRDDSHGSTAKWVASGLSQLGSAPPHLPPPLKRYWLLSMRSPVLAS
jgi:hypothetical protein